MTSDRLAHGILCVKALQRPSCCLCLVVPPGLAFVARVARAGLGSAWMAVFTGWVESSVRLFEFVVAVLIVITRDLLLLPLIISSSSSFDRAISN